MNKSIKQWVPLHDVLETDLVIVVTENGEQGLIALVERKKEVNEEVEVI